jgi:hypothetical protein
LWGSQGGSQGGEDVHDLHNQVIELVGRIPVIAINIY